MKMYLLSGFILLLAVSCIRENAVDNYCREQLVFEMKDVPYLFKGDTALAFRPYYQFTERLDLFVFEGQRLRDAVTYSYEYCLEHPFIPYQAVRGDQQFLFVSNLYDPKELDWKFKDGHLQAVFSILDNEEPPVLLCSITEAAVNKSDTLPVGLRMLVSRLEIRVDNPPAWVTGLDVTLSNVAGTVTSGLELGDTTHINRRVDINNLGAGTYWVGVNTFPSYPNSPALLKIELVGTSQIAPILVDDDRLQMLAGIITRVSIAFQSESQISVSIEIDGEWKIIDGGNIII